MTAKTSASFHLEVNTRQEQKAVWKEVIVCFQFLINFGKISPEEEYLKLP